MSEDYKHLRRIIRHHNPLFVRTATRERIRGNELSIEKGIYDVAKNCDGPYAKDDIGFGNKHTVDGHRLASLIKANYGWTIKDQGVGLRVYKSYSRQLSDRYSPSHFEDALRRNVFSFEPMAEENYPSLWMGYSPDRRVVSLNLPFDIETKGQHRSALTDLWGLVRATGVSLAPSMAAVSKRVQRGENSDVEFHVGSPGTREFMIALFEMGYVADDRIARVASDPRSSYLRIFHKPTRTGDLLMARIEDFGKNEALKGDLRELFQGAEFQNKIFVEVSSEKIAGRYATKLEFPFGPTVTSRLENILTHHNVGGAMALGDYLSSDQSRESLCHNVLRGTDRPQQDFWNAPHAPTPQRY